MSSIPLVALDAAPRPAQNAPPDPLQEFQRASALKTAAGQQQIQQQTVQQNDIALQQQQMQLADMKKLRDLAPQYVQKNDDGTVKGYDIDGMANGALAAGINPQTVAGLRNTYAESVKNLAGANKAQLDLEQEKNDKAFEVLEGLRGLAPKPTAATPQVQGGPQATPAPVQPGPQSAPVPGTGGMPAFMLPNMPQGGGDPSQAAAAQPQAAPQVQVSPEAMQGYHSAIMKLARLGINVGQLNPNQFPTDDQLNGFEAGLGTHKQALADAKTVAETTKATSEGKKADVEAQTAVWKPAGEGSLVNLQTGQMIHGVAPVEREELQDYLNKHPGQGASDFASWKAKQAPLARFQIETGSGGQGGGNSADAAATAKRYGMTPAAFDQTAEKYFTTGQLPQVGRGISGIGLNREIMNRAAALHPGASLAENSAEFAANKTSLGKLQTQFDQVNAFENTAGKNLDLFLNQAKKVIDTGSPWINKPLRSIDQNALGSEDQAALGAARTTALTEISKVLNSANATGVLSDSARHEVSGLIGEGATLKQIVSAANILKQDMANRHQSYADQIKDIQGRIGGGSAAPAPASQQPTGKAVSLAAAKQLPSMQGKSDDEIRAAIVAAGHQVAP